MKQFTRRDFLKFSAAGVGALLLQKIKFASAVIPEFPTGERLGRLFATYNIMSKPDIESAPISPDPFFQDKVINLYREVVGTNDSRMYRSKLWYETDGGYIYAPNVQPVKNLPNEPLVTLPTYGTQPGFWAEVTVPYVDLIFDGEIPKSPLLIDILSTNQIPRFYFSQVLWIDGITTGDFGETLYHIKEPYGSYGDLFWADARAFKPLTPDDLLPINPEAADKKIVVNLTHQTLSCFEGSREVFFTTVSTGAKYNFDGQAVKEAWATPTGENHVVNRKYVSLHMAGGDENKATGGWEEFAVSYTSIFASGGISFHSTYWHNAWGSPMSHGCVNMRPDESKFLYRWTLPEVPYAEGMVDQQGYAGTKVQVIE